MAPLDFLVADYETPGKLRGYASFDKADAALTETQGPRRSGRAARQGPRGHDHRSGRRHGSLPGHRGAARASRWSMPRIPISASPSRCRPSSGWRWRGTTGRAAPAASRSGAGGPAASWSSICRAKAASSRPRARRTTTAWQATTTRTGTACAHLAATVEDHELLDPMLSPERLLYRLFHEEGVRVSPATGAGRRVPVLARAHSRLSRPLRRRRAERHARGGRQRSR